MVNPRRNPSFRRKPTSSFEIVDAHGRNRTLPDYHEEKERFLHGVNRKRQAIVRAKKIEREKALLQSSTEKKPKGKKMPSWMRELANPKSKMPNTLKWGQLREILEFAGFTEEKSGATAQGSKVPWKHGSDVIVVDANIMVSPSHQVNDRDLVKRIAKLIRQ